ncbi:MAG: adenylate cyclase [Cyclobacteriaceae bacterium]|jgi:TolB-like protein/Tfp pilus assembly protein PilF
MKIIQELQRRNVIKASISYLVISWVILQVSDIVFPLIGWGDERLKLLFIVLLSGFLPWAIFAYIYELTPSGFRKTNDVEATESMYKQTNKKLNAYIISGLTLVVVLLVVERVFFANSSVAIQADKSVAILPFKNLSASEDVYFAAGMTQDILTHVSQIADLRVLSDFTINNYDYDGKSAEMMGDELGVAYILTGNVRRSEKDLRISCQLVGTHGEGAIWSKTYDKQMTNVFAVQSEIAQEIAATLKASLSEKEKDQLDRKPTENLLAYDFYLKSAEYDRKYDAPSTLKAIDLLKEAITLDPTFSLAYSSLAGNYMSGIQNFGLFPVSYLDTAFVLAQKGVDLGPDFSGTWHTLGMAYSMLGKKEQAVMMYQKALEINPNGSATINNLASHYFYENKQDQAIAMYKKSILLKAQNDPGNVIVYGNLSFAYSGLGLYGRAIEYAEKALQMKEYYYSYLAYGVAQYGMGDTIGSFNSIRNMVLSSKESLPSLSIATASSYEYFNTDTAMVYLGKLKSNPNFSYNGNQAVRIYEAIELRKIGLNDSAETLLENSLDYYLSKFERGMKEQVWLLDVTAIYTAMGQYDKALQWLEKGIDDGYPLYYAIYNSNLYKDLHNYPKYEKVMASLKAQTEKMRQRVLDAEATEQLKDLNL